MFSECAGIPLLYLFNNHNSKILPPKITLSLFHQRKLHILFWKVFKVRDSSAVGRESQSVAESVLTFFSGFEAFTLPSPTVDPEALKSISDNKSLINPSFTSGLEDFRHLVRGIVRPKNSVNDGEFVTGGGKGRL